MIRKTDNIFKIRRVAKWSRAVISNQRGVGSSPMTYFCYFFIFNQTLRPIFGLGRSWAIEGPFLFHSRGFRELLDISLIQVQSRAICVSLVWKIALFRSKNERFLPFLQS